jgi:hypothetical protein
MAASTLCCRLLAGPRTPLTVANRSRDAWLLTLPGRSGAVSLQTRRAVLLPPALVVQRLPLVAVPVEIGAGALWYDGNRVVVHRWFAPSRVLPGDLPLSAASDRRVRGFLAGWRELVGRGEGLTPYGDDVVCGALLGLRATGEVRAGELAEQVRAFDLEARTTALSAALLRCAADGWCVPEVAAAVSALSCGRRVEATCRRLRAVGHSSGRGLLAGLFTVLELREREVAA